MYIRSEKGGGRGERGGGGWRERGRGGKGSCMDVLSPKVLPPVSCVIDVIYGCVPPGLHVSLP